MMGKTHMVFGSLFMAAGAPALAAITHTQLTPVTFALGIGLAVIPGLLPDIDHPNALLSRGWMPFKRKLGPLGRLLGEFLSLPPRIMGMMSRSVMGHRGGTHSLLFCLLWTIAALPIYALLFAGAGYVVSLFTGLVGFGFSPGVVWEWEKTNLPTIMPLAMITVFLGYLSHIFADGLNNVPVPYLWPSKRRFFLIPKAFKSLRVTTGSPREGLVRLITIVLLGVVILINLINPVLNNLSDGSGIIESLTTPMGYVANNETKSSNKNRIKAAIADHIGNKGDKATDVEAEMISTKATCLQKNEFATVYKAQRERC